MTVWTDKRPLWQREPVTRGYAAGWAHVIPYRRVELYMNMRLALK